MKAFPFSNICIRNVTGSQLESCSCCASSADGAETASEEGNCSKNNCDDTNYKTGGSSACRLTCCLECLLSRSRQNKTNDSERKCYDGAVTKPSKNESYDAAYETGNTLSFHDNSPFKDLMRTAKSCA